MFPTFPCDTSKGNMIPASQPQIPYCRISCMRHSQTPRARVIGCWVSMLSLVTHNQLLMPVVK